MRLTAFKARGLGMLAVCGALFLSLTTLTPASVVNNVTVQLQPGWNGVGFQCQSLTDLTGNPQISGFATFNPATSSYTTGNFNFASLNSSGLRKGYWVFAQSATSFTYSGVDDGQGNFVDLVAGYNMVSFCTNTDIPGANLTARQGGTTVPLGSIVLPQFSEIGVQGQPYVQTDVTAGGSVKAGKAYWVFASQPCRLTWTTTPSASPSPTTSPGVVTPVSRFPVDGATGVQRTNLPIFVTFSGPMNANTLPPAYTGWQVIFNRQSGGQVTVDPSNASQYGSWSYSDQATSYGGVQIPAHSLVFKMTFGLTANSFYSFNWKFNDNPQAASGTFQSNVPPGQFQTYSFTTGP